MAKYARFHDVEGFGDFSAQFSAKFRVLKKIWGRYDANICQVLPTMQCFAI